MDVYSRGETFSKSLSPRPFSKNFREFFVSDARRINENKEKKYLCGEILFKEKISPHDCMKQKNQVVQVFKLSLFLEHKQIFMCK